MSYSYEEVTDSQQYEYWKQDYSDDKGFLKDLINNHWGYIEGVLRAANQAHSFDDEYELEHKVAEIGFHYKTAMEHGWKHACEYYGVGNANS